MQAHVKITLSLSVPTASFTIINIYIDIILTTRELLAKHPSANTATHPA